MPAIPYYHVYTDENGMSRQTKAELKRFEEKSVGGDADPQWMKHLTTAECRVMFMVLPVGWVGEWHENPYPQWILPISGSWYVETMDGERVEMGPGELSFGGDQNTVKDADGRYGHVSGTVGAEPCRMMVIQLTGEKYVGAMPGDFA